MTAQASLDDLQSHAEPVAMGSDRSFGLVATGFFAIVGLLPLAGGGSVRMWALAAAGALAVISLVRPSVLHWPNRIWFRFGLILHKVTTPIILGALFFAVITPFGLLMRLVGRDPLRLKVDPQAETYWIARTPGDQRPESMKNQF